jgi:uncharacterized protein
MRLRKKMIDHVAKTIGHSLVDKSFLELDIPMEPFVAEISRLITADLLVEDHLNDEVKDILRTHMHELDRGNIDYSRMFAMVKRKLVQERGLIL